ncbi:MAG: hypothetical protein ACYCW6_21410 [Candidatus Xenobia bacterium]
MATATATAPAPVENPLVVLRLERGLTARQMALLVGCGVPFWYEVEAGTVANPRRVFDALTALGHDGSGLRTRYLAWREQERRRLSESCMPALTA